MKTTSFLMCFLTASLSVAFSEENSTPATATVPATVAQNTDNADNTVTATQLKNLTSVLKDGKFVKQEPKLTAKYYLILTSASWCGPCHKEMPHMVKAYEEIAKDPEVELIHVSADRSPEAALKWANETKPAFPVISFEDAEKTPFLQDKAPDSIPHLYILNAKGNKIASGYSPRIFAQYKETIAQDKAKQAQK